jgi:LAO/AO transport system kinase
VYVYDIDVGDKTRMDQLSKSDDCYVRASPTRGVLGGIAEHTADVITLCEAGAVHHSRTYL